MFNCEVVKKKKIPRAKSSIDIHRKYSALNYKQRNKQNHSVINGVNTLNNNTSSLKAKNHFNKTMSHFISNQKHNVLDNSKEFIKDFTSYLNVKQKERESYKRFTAPRQEVIKKLLNETKSESNIFNKTFSTTIMNSSEYTTLNDFYKTGHIFNNKASHYKDDYDDELNSERDYLYWKYNLKKPLDSNEKSKLKLKNKRKHSGVIEIHDDTHYYKNQYDAYNLLKLNKNLHDHLMVHLNEEQIKSYLTKHFKVEEEKLKIDLMPKIKTIPLIHRKKPKKEEYNYQQNIQLKNIKPTINKLADAQTLSRKMLFEEYHFIMINTIQNFLITPTSRSDAKMIEYFDEKSEMNKLLMYGGMNLTRLGELWECSLSHNDYKWKRVTGITGDNPLPRSGHSMCLYKNDIVIYGGVVEDEKAYHFREDILIYNIPEKKFMADVCTNKGNVIWRKNHIAEIIGQFMFVYGGIDDNGKVLSEPCALDLYRMKWIQAKFSSGTILPKLYYLSSQLVFSPQKRQHPKLSLFKLIKNFQSFTNLAYEGIFLFGGINENGKCSNDVLIIQRGKPLTMIKPEIQGMPPLPRCQCSMNLFDKLNVLIIHGGRNENINASFLNDFFLLDLEQMKWIRLETNNNEITSRAGHSAGMIGTDLIIFGGYNDRHYVKSDLMVCNMDIIECGNLLRKCNRGKKDKKKNDNERDVSNELGRDRLAMRECNDNVSNCGITNTQTNIINGMVNTNAQNSNLINIKESPYVLINSKLQSSKNFFEKFPLQKQLLKQRFEEIDKINFLSHVYGSKHERTKGTIFPSYEGI